MSRGAQVRNRTMPPGSRGSQPSSCVAQERTGLRSGSVRPGSAKTRRKRVTRNSTILRQQLWRTVTELETVRGKEGVPRRTTCALVCPTAAGTPAQTSTTASGPSHVPPRTGCGLGACIGTGRATDHVNRHTPVCLSVHARRPMAVRHGGGTRADDVGPW